MKKIAYVSTNGCPENRIDCARVEVFLKENGWVLSSNSKSADLVIFNACGLTEIAEDTSLRIIKKLNSNKKIGAQLIVCGCLPKINRNRINEVVNTEIFGGASLNKLAARVVNANSNNTVCANYLIEGSKQPLTLLGKYRHLKKEGWSTLIERAQKTKYKQLWDTINIVQPNTYYIKVSSGCENSCSYCAVKLSRGKTKSKSIKEIKKELIEGLNSGYEHFAFIGTDLGSYGKDIQTDLLTLLNEIVLLDGKFDIKLRNVHPQLIISELQRFIKVIDSGKITHITTAIQHGSNRILKLMNRYYDISDCKYAFNYLKSRFPSLKIRTQLMVGFPGETKADFNETLNFIDEVNLDFYEVYKYSPRPRTLARKLPYQIPVAISAKRKTILLEKVINILGDNRTSNSSNLALNSSNFNPSLKYG